MSQVWSLGYECLLSTRARGDECGGAHVWRELGAREKRGRLLPSLEVRTLLLAARWRC